MGKGRKWRRCSTSRGYPCTEIELKRILVEVETHRNAQVTEEYVLHTQIELDILIHQAEARGREAVSQAVQSIQSVLRCWYPNWDDFWLNLEWGKSSKHLVSARLTKYIRLEVLRKDLSTVCYNSMVGFYDQTINKWLWNYKERDWGSQSKGYLKFTKCQKCQKYQNDRTTILWWDLGSHHWKINETIQKEGFRVPIQKVNQKFSYHKNASKIPLNLPRSDTVKRG